MTDEIQSLKESGIESEQSDPKSLGKRLLSKIATPDECQIVGCEDPDVKLKTILALDPIDHDDTDLWLCPTHTVWAEDRNEFAREIQKELRQARKRIGQEHYEQVREHARPDDGELPHEVAMGHVDSVEESDMDSLDESSDTPSFGDPE